MAGITLATAEQRLESWLAADAAVSEGQSYTIGSRSLTRADAAEIRRNITYWNSWVQRLSRGNGGGARVRYGVPTDA